MLCDTNFFTWILGPRLNQLVEIGINKQINYELSAHYAYLSMVRETLKVLIHFTYVYLRDNAHSHDNARVI
mgnify:CR=1 FL=1